MIRRTMTVCKLKEECKQQYLYLHNNIWKELVEEYHEGGIREISCFMDGQMLYVVSEFDDTKQPSGVVDKVWQKLVAPCADETFPKITPVEVFRMESGRKE